MRSPGVSDAQLDLLVRDCWPRLVRTAYLLTGAEPAAQELVRAALRRCLDDWRGAGAPDGAESQLQVAVVREAFRQRALYSAGSAPFAESGGGAEPMRAVLRQLPLDERAVLVMRFRDGLTVEQVVDVLRAPDGIVRKREKRALRALHEAAVVRSDGEPRADELRTMLDAVADVVPWSSPPDATALLEGTSRRGRRRLVLLAAAAAAALAAVAAGAHPF